MFTMENTEGFTQSDLDLLNAAAQQLVEVGGMDESNAADIVNNNWNPDGGNTIASLTA